MRAWVSKESIVDGKRKRAKCQPGVRGIGDADQFVVEFIDPTGKRRREKVGIRGKPGKRAADRLAVPRCPAMEFRPRNCRQASGLSAFLFIST